jgi:LacI family transcriptional regulator
VPGAAHLVVFVTPDLAESHFSAAARGAARVLRQAGYTLLVANTESDPATEAQALELLMACRQVDGLIIASSQPPDEAELFHRLQRHSLPFVLLERRIAGVEASFVGWDDEAIGAAATEHLISRGCRHIAHLRGPATSSADLRLRGYTEALVRANLKVCPGYVAPGGAGADTGYQATRQLLAVNPRLDGIVCYNDAVAVGAIKATLEAGLEIPYDLEVIGAGNLPYGDVLKVPLSTVELHGDQAGEQAANLLLEALGGAPQPPRSVLVPFEVIPRESSRAIAV